MLLGEGLSAVWRFGGIQERATADSRGHQPAQLTGHPRAFVDRSPAPTVGCVTRSAGLGNLSRASNYKIKVQKKRGKKWKTVKITRTKGKLDRRTLNLRR